MRASRLGAAVLGLALFVLTGWTMASPASAHVRTTEGTSVIRQHGHDIRIELRVEQQLLANAAGRGRLESYLTERVTVSLDGIVCEPALTRTGVEQRQEVVYATSVLDYACPGEGSGSYLVRYDLFTETDAVVDEYTNLADYELGGRSGTYVFDSAHRELEAGRTGFLQAGLRFLTMGVEHIVGGIDHVLFVIVLLLGAKTFRGVVKVATAFTLAHSVTLALGVLGWVNVPAQIVEPLIALSIAYVAVENILGGESRHRLAVVFGFGLLHGLGFAGTLSFTDDLSPRLLGSLLSFNLGIEVGQAIVIVLVFPLLLLLRRLSWSAAVHLAATGLAALFGLVWFVQRIFA
ncbi:HupE/UreJ family protein [Flindersiella endophytica]